MRGASGIFQKDIATQTMNIAQTMTIKNLKHILHTLILIIFMEM